MPLTQLFLFCNKTERDCGQQGEMTSTSNDSIHGRKGKGYVTYG